MAILEVLRFPDQRLRIKTKEIKKVSEELKKLAQDMLETMYQQNGFGLASTQVGRTERFAVIDIMRRLAADEDAPPRTDLEKAVSFPLFIFNAKIVKATGKTVYQEGCLSVPTYYENVNRFKYVEVKALDLNGDEILVKADGLLAIVLQHEIDHLDGKLFIDRLSLIKSTRIKNRIRKEGYPEKEEKESEAGL